MRRVFIGDPDVVALETELEEPIDPHWMFGHFRMFVRGTPIGDWDDIATVGAIVSWWRDFADAPQDRWETAFAGLTPAALFHAVFNMFYGEMADFVPGARARYDVSILGMSAFEYYTLILVEPPGDEQWLLWREERGNRETWVVRHEVLPQGTLQTAGAEFVAAVAAVAGA